MVEINKFKHFNIYKNLASNKQNFITTLIQIIRIYWDQSNYLGFKTKSWIQHFLLTFLLESNIFCSRGHMNFQVLNQDFQKQKRNKTKFMEAIKTTTKIPDFEGKLNELFSQGRK